MLGMKSDQGMLLSSPFLFSLITSVSSVTRRYGPLCQPSSRSCERLFLRAIYAVCTQVIQFCVPWKCWLAMCIVYSIHLKGNKGQNQYLTYVFVGIIQVTFRKCVLYPDKVNFEISPLQVGIRSLGWDHCGHNPNKRSSHLHHWVRQAERQNLGPAWQAVQNYVWCWP